ncbi:glycine--tRNA ligase subunit beta [Buchnera aphidicola]|uniref:Glycine--tRNA ligase beta subunit n=1 Tax=Buchnera aphidicola (Sarucallis kahawaluokalani) TaxID=1241878 RepID=A0A4D6Y7K1_9GAMM|nr:glycine--tRNA ligase subunit beta [Buchnera aphidicola]QCI25896.1 glycine--tRNA ligase subunit beta [Buchnera aphidicola (Sarucallis kahawaluokalani)]
MNYKTCLIELNVEDIPAKQVRNISRQFYCNIVSELNKYQMKFSKINLFDTHRRIAVIIKKINTKLMTQTIEHRGPAIKYSFNDQGQIMQPALKWLKKFNITLTQIHRIHTEKGTWLSYKKIQKKKSIKDVLLNIIKYALKNIFIKKNMLWNNNNNIKFIRPIRKILILLQEQFIPFNLENLFTKKYLYGNIFTKFKKINIQNAEEYENILYKKGKVIAKYKIRKKKIQYQAKKIANTIQGKIYIHENLLEEITYLVEWPKIFLGKFKKKFLHIPKKIIIYVMEKIQKFIPIYYIHDNKFTNYFIIVANTHTKNYHQIILENERVLHARLFDISFFIEKDQKKTLQENFLLLKDIIFHEKLGNMLDKSYRLMKLITQIAKYTNTSLSCSIRAAYLSKCDLNTNMVYEFPELRGIIGKYYALKNGESKNIALSIQEQYKPKFSQDTLPSNTLSCTLALAEKIDTIVGLFLINYKPKKDKDPFFLRRLTIGIIRIIIEKKIDINLTHIIKYAILTYSHLYTNKNHQDEIMNFIKNRLYAWYKKKHNINIIKSIVACHKNNLLKINLILNTVLTFKENIHFKKLIFTYKRIFNLLKKNKICQKQDNINYQLIQNEKEKILFIITNNIHCILYHLIQHQKYSKILQLLFTLNQPINDFLDQNSIKYTKKNIQNNRIILLYNIQKIFLSFIDFMKL